MLSTRHVTAGACAVLTSLGVLLAAAPTASATVGPMVVAVPGTIVETDNGGVSIALTGVGFPPGMGLTVNSVGLQNACEDSNLSHQATADYDGNFNVTISGTGCAPGEYEFSVSENTSPYQTFDDAAMVTVEPPAPVILGPVITTISPDTGLVAGGTAVTITGTGFTGATAVTFGALPATSFTVVSDDEIDAVTPAGTAGPVPVTVTTPGGTSVPAGFLYAT